MTCFLQGAKCETRRIFGLIQQISVFSCTHDTVDIPPGKVGCGCNKVPVLSVLARYRLHSRGSMRIGMHKHEPLDRTNRCNPLPFKSANIPPCVFSGHVWKYHHREGEGRNQQVVQLTQVPTGSGESGLCQKYRITP